MRIEDGYNGTSAKVDSSNRLHTKSVTQTEEQSQANEGYTYNINTGTINLTSANKSAVLYLKNNSTKDLKITTVGYLFGNSTSGSGDLALEILRNPTGGTIVSGASDVTVNINKNFGSPRTLLADVYKGAEGNTLTGGEVALPSLLAGSARTYIIGTGVLIIPQGQSIGVNITPQSGNTSMNVMVFLAVTEGPDSD
jgi:hypothetical protein